MEIPKNVKIGAIVLVGVAFAFLAGYTIFSYFSRNRTSPEETQQVQNTPELQTEDDTEGISPVPGSVAGASNFGDSEGISPTPGPTGSTNNQNTLKGGVLGESTTDTEDGIAPSNAKPQKTTITPEDRADYKRSQKTEAEVEEDDNDNSEITSSRSPEVNAEDDYIEYIYSFDLNDDAQDRYKEGFLYSIDAGTCDDDDYFTSSSYDFTGIIESDEIDGEVEITVRIKEEYIDDEFEFDNSDYKFDGKNYTVTGETNVPVCED